MSNLRLKGKILLPVVVLIIVILATTISATILRFRSFTEYLMNERIAVAATGLRQFPEDMRRKSIDIGIQIAADERIIAGVLNADTPELLRVGQELVDYHEITFVTVMDINAIALARTHTPERYGDPIETPRLRDATRGIYSVAHGPMGDYLATIRASVPIHYQGEIIGALIAAQALDRQETVEALMELYNAEFTIFIENERVASTILDDQGNSIVGSTLDDEDFMQTVIRQRDEIKRPITFYGRTYSGFYLPLIDDHGIMYAIIFMGLPIAGIEAQNSAVIIMVFIMSLAGLGIAILLLYIVVSKITKPIEGLVSNAKQVAHGNFSVKFDTDRPDEVGALSRAFAGIVQSLCTLKENINDTVYGNQNNNMRPLKGSFAELMKTAEDAIVREQLANKAKTNFLARMSHEIRTPMNSVLGITEIELQKDTLSAETEDSFMRIYNSSNMLLGLINDILDLSKVEAGKMEIIPALYETASMIIDTVQLNLMYIGSKQVEFKLEIDENLPAYVVGDELRVKQILNNILSNAFKYTLEGEVKLSFNAVPTDEENSVIVEIKVSDTGQGMTKKQVENLQSSEFIRFNLESNRHVEGTGLGLNIAYQLARMMGGEISVESTPGVGSTFLLRLPQGVNDTGVIGAEAAMALQNLEDTQTSIRKLSKLEREPMPYGRVLVVDDVESNLFVAKGFLIPYKLAVDTVDSGILAVEKIRDGEVYDIIFMDHMMPDMDGVETTKLIREMGYNHPIIALTANAFCDMADMFKSCGFTDFASKPIDMNQMDRHLMKHIRDKQSPEIVAQAREAKASRMSENINELSSELISSFVRDAKKAIGIMENSDVNDPVSLKSYIIQVHSMKSALNNVKRTDLSNRARVLEQAARRNEIDTITEATPQFIKQVYEVIKTLEASLRGNAPPAEDAAEDKTVLKNRLRFIADACEVFDIDSAKDALAELGQINFSAQTKASIREVYDLVSVSEFDEAAELAIKIASQA
ncbi:MAG: ATP-binding protein [Defluviitaleaceae bacterium]|nr:ATP-binding protein [Defluviitaleaceae bacterium]